MATSQDDGSGRKGQWHGNRKGPPGPRGRAGRGPSKKPRRPVKDLARAGYTEEEVIRILTELAVRGGNASKTERELKAQGVRIPTYDTLLKWKNHRYPDRYETLVVDLAPTLAQQAEETAWAATEAAKDGIVKGHEALRELPTPTNTKELSELSTATRNFSTSAGIHHQHAHTYRGRPTVVTKSVDPEEAWSRLQTLLGGPVVDATVVDDEKPPRGELPKSSGGD